MIHKSHTTNAAPNGVDDKDSVVFLYVAVFNFFESLYTQIALPKTTTSAIILTIWVEKMKADRRTSIISKK